MRWALLALATLPLLLYANSATNAFHYDDFHSLVNNPHIRKLENIPSFFTSARTTSSNIDKGHYRPVLFSTYALSYALGGYDYDPKTFRLFNIILHTMNGLLVFALFRQMFGRTAAAALFGALFFAAHPMHTESVNYISCRSNVMATTFYLISVLLFVCYSGCPSRGRRRALYAGSLGCFGLGLLTKEIVITLPAILLLADLLILRPPPVGAGANAGNSRARPTSSSQPEARFDFKTLFRRHAMFWILAGVHLLLIFAVRLKPVYERRDVLSNLLIQTKAMVYYLLLLVFPRGLSISHSFDTEGTVNAAFWASLLVIAGALLLAWNLRGRGALLSFAILWYFITLLPTSSVLALNVPVNEHRTYLPAVGFSLAVAFSLDLIRTGRGTGRARRGQFLAKLVVPLFAVVIGIFSFAVIARNHTWATAVALWEDAVKKYPVNAHAHETLGLEYGKVGDLNAAEREFLLALRHGGDGKTLAKSHNGLGIIYAQREDYESAIEHFKRSAEMDPRSVEPHHNLGITFAKQGKPERAVEYFQKCLEINPLAERPYCDLAHTYLDLGRADMAASVLQEMAARGIRPPENLRKRFEAATENP